MQMISVRILKKMCIRDRDKRVETFESISAVLENYYAMKNTITRIRQRSSDLRRIVNTALERNRKKYELQHRQLKDTEKREKFRVYGELINTYGYNLEPGAKKPVSYTHLDVYKRQPSAWSFSHPEVFS